jgi:hypothetical protein
VENSIVRGFIIVLSAREAVIIRLMESGRCGSHMQHVWLRDEMYARIHL